MRIAPKNQRFGLLVLAVAAVLVAVLLAMSALRHQAAYFYSPNDVVRDHIPPGQPIRLGGVVVDHSIMRQPDGVTLLFKVTDGHATVPVRYRGIVPDLFRERAGVIADGRFDPSGTFDADQILAKHDENYRPPVQAGSRHKSASART